MSLSLGFGAIVVISIYLGLMIGLGVLARSRISKRDGESLSEFYLAGRSLGPLVLLLTLYATQYKWQHRRRLSGRGVAAGLRLDHERELHDGDHRRLFALCSATPASR